ncbi:lysoplasmalogenase family protein [Desulfoluna sp.]|uniref:lysoplasmalogenase family protein n=1 Tax=Desulfoluna sp. TaxID=2045199 RepID=UPI002608BACA|nr:lysoplasmalogenase family protein [Desulfoluna sp.]
MIPFIQHTRFKIDLRRLLFTLYILNALIHIGLTNLPGHAYAVTKVLLMPLLCGFFLATVKDIKKGGAIAWALCGLWMGNICLIWGETSRVLFFSGSFFTVVGLFGYVRVFLRETRQINVLFVFLQIPVIWSCASFVLVMKDDLHRMLIPISLYMTLVGLISTLALARLFSEIRSRGTWLMFTGTLFYIAENGLYTADPYMTTASFGAHIVHPCFIMAQTLIVCGYLLHESER